MIKEEKIPYRIIAVVGPTASGKSKLAIEIAQEFGGEIINADSRQVYKDMNIGTAKDPDDNPSDQFYTVEGIQHHLIDFLKPNEKYSVAEFQRSARNKITDLVNRNKLPILVGGTGLWIDSVCNTNYEFKEAEADWELREKLKGESVTELFNQLSCLNPQKSKSLNNSDRKNPVRLIRLIEKELNKDSLTKINKKAFEENIKTLYLSPKINFSELEQKIQKRVEDMIERGLVEEVKELIKKGFNFGLPSMSGIGYKELEDYLKGDKTIEMVKAEIKLRTRQYAKRQITWFKKNKNINYVDLIEAKRLVKKFLVL